MLVKFFATYRQITGCKTCDVPAPGSVLALMEDLSERWPEFRDLILNEDGTDKGDDVIIMVNGRTSPSPLSLPVGNESLGLSQRLIGKRGIYDRSQSCLEDC